MTLTLYKYRRRFRTKVELLVFCVISHPNCDLKMPRDRDSKAIKISGS